MNNFLFFGLALLVLAACEREVENICTYQITNESSKLISTQIEMDPQGMITLTCLPGDSTFYLQKGRWSTVFERGVYYKGVAFFNLNDTTSYVLSDFLDKFGSLHWPIDLYPEPTTQDTLLFRSWVFNDLGRDNDAWNLFWKVTLTDELVNTFQKDTSMLRKFKAYYNR